MTRAITSMFLLSMLLVSGLLSDVHSSTQLVSNTVSLNHITAGISIDSVARVDNAASLGVNTAIVYGQPFTPSDPVGAEMQAKGMHEIDAGISSELTYYECHRTHTVAPPPQGTPNTYCATDKKPWINSESVVLADVDAMLKADAANPLVVGYWVLDDWAFLWDAGSGKTILQDIRKEIRLYTPSYPAICGFGMAIVQPNVNAWDPRIAQNYSNAGCDMVGIYSYVSTYPTPSDGSQFDFTMQTMLAAAFKSLRQFGWDRSKRSLLGIGQAFAGPYETGYKPGISVVQMKAQAKAFCNAGAVSIGWYGWDDPGFGSQALLPMTSTIVQQGIISSITACQSVWSRSKKGG